MDSAIIADHWVKIKESEKIDKYLDVTREKWIHYNRIKLSTWETMREPDENGYKYLGIFKVDDIQYNDMKVDQKLVHKQT